MVGKYLAICNICLSLGASIGYAFCGNIRMCIYWAAAATINMAVTL